MTRILVLLVALIPAVTLALAEDQSRQTKSRGSGPPDVEPAILKGNPSPERAVTEAPGDAVARCEKKLEAAKENIKGIERLCKTGVLSKAEMEERLLKAIQCEAELASARLVETKQKIADLQSAAASDENAKNQLASAKVALKQLGEAAEAAAAKRNRAELEAAEANVRRQQALLKRGVAAKSDVDRAEEKLAELKAQRN
jgi:multidrug resistance efflux pump